MSYKTNRLVEIDLIEYDDGGIMFDQTIREKDGSSSNTGSNSLVGCVIEMLAETELLTHKEIDVYKRLHNDHLEVLDTLILSKIKEALKVGDEIREMYYIKKKN